MISSQSESQQQWSNFVENDLTNDDLTSDDTEAKQQGPSSKRRHYSLEDDMQSVDPAVRIGTVMGIGIENGKDRNNPFVFLMTPGASEPVGCLISTALGLDATIRGRIDHFLTTLEQRCMTAKKSSQTNSNIISVKKEQGTWTCLDQTSGKTIVLGADTSASVKERCDYIRQKGVDAIL